MGTRKSRIIGVLNAFHAARPWDHNAHFHRWILRTLPRRFDRALDVGCGTGDLARALAARAGAVDALDADADTVARARALTPSSSPVTYTVGSAPEGLPPGPYDVITCVAVLHHLPFTESLQRFRAELAPGGTLVVVGLARPETGADRARDLTSAVSNVAMALVKNRGRKVPRPAAMTAPVKPPTMTLADISREAERVLPGVRVRGRLFWRHTLVWHAETSGSAHRSL
ncbi:Ubiquinone biosynthesis O-methyltransferase [Streptomyces sp. YIM 130001]|uniref:class I SAM-dependent methyltransferase n=1 Tax=Streptomyces sp. YIM 130001 TaxID=2259644 RepID=UPI000E64E6FF|nr:class I SAM-dependent methyltransferase [Streptomyces sp. YIM 130001]RII14689.1 Ubiquinone biosynthesis O-methyltransferase [Streptomyces sp. YIM 130001]